ncbi:MAG: HtrA2 peptidase, partial [uncultured bacterium]
LLNSAGQVIGVNVAVAQTAQNIGFAIPINVVKKALQEFERSGKFASKPFLGVKYQTISQDTANLNAVPQGAYIVEVVAGSPAENAGVVAGDIVTKIDTEQLGEDKELSDVVGGKFVGSVVTLEIWRDNATLSLSATLSEFSE